MTKHIEGQCWIWEKSGARAEKNIAAHNKRMLAETAQKAAESYVRKFGVHPTHFSAKDGIRMITVKLGDVSVSLRRHCSNQEQMIIVGI